MERDFKLLKQGHPDAMEFIYARHSRHIFFIGRQLIQDEFVVETIMQDAFLKLWMLRDTIERPEHVFFFLRHVVKRECTFYYCRPRNKFYRSINRLEFYENYQDYMYGFDPEAEEDQHLLDQKSEQEYYDRIRKVLPFIEPKRKQVIELCLKYDFKYAIISKLMGISVKHASNEVYLAIDDLKQIIHRGSKLDQPNRLRSDSKQESQKMTNEQAKVLKLRCDEKQSFSKIAEELQLPQKEVHRQFMIAYKMMQQKHEEQLQTA